MSEEKLKMQLHERDGELAASRALNRELKSRAPMKVGVGTQAAVGGTVSLLAGIGGAAIERTLPDLPPEAVFGPIGVLLELWGVWTKSPDFAAGLMAAGSPLTSIALYKLGRVSTHSVLDVMDGVLSETESTPPPNGNPGPVPPTGGRPKVPGL